MVGALSHKLAATHVPITWSGCGTARVDGVLSPGEWSGASHQVITVNTAAGALPATLYVMNDNLTIFMALEFPESSSNYGSLVVEFDNDNNGVPFEAGDDAIVYNNRLGFFDDFRKQCPTGMCAPEDVSDSGSTEGRGAYVNDGTNSVYELSHPARTFDNGHDVAVCVPGVACNTNVGFFISLRQIDSVGAIHDTYYPDVAVYDQVQLQTCPISVLSGCGTATTDGRIDLTEWNGAGQHRLSVETTPRGDTATGTLYLMNDSFNAYMALAFDQPAALAFNQLDVDFDNNGSSWIGDDHLIFSTWGGFFDYVGTPCPPPQLGSPPCRNDDAFGGGTTDGSGGFANDGTQSATEISHPLNSGDSHDFALSYGDTVPYRLTFETSDQYPGMIGLTVVPTPGTGIARWMICTPAPTESVGDMIRRVKELAACGGLAARNAETLTKELVRTNGHIQSGEFKQAAYDLADFSKDVTGLMRKKELADQAGQQLITAANSAIANL